MFERLIKRRAAITRHLTGPLLTERLAYLHHLEHQHYSLKSLTSAATTTLAVAEALNLANRPGQTLSLSELTHHADLWATRHPTTLHRRPGASSRATYLQYAKGWLTFLGRLDIPPPQPHPYAQQIDAFIDYQRCERGLSSATLRGRRHMIQRALEMLSKTRVTLADLTINHIDVILLNMTTAGRYSRESVQTYAVALRAFFRYAESCGWCRKGLAASVEAPRVYSQANLPVGPSWEAVQKLIATTNGNEAHDIRARAILMLLTVYGLRAGDVRRLRLDDIDWEHETLVVCCPKNRHPRTYPLNVSVGHAILRYLQEVRPRSAHRELFLTLGAPFRPMNDLWHVVSSRLQPLGLSIPRHGPHALRHACATHLLEQGLSMKEIGDHLGHRDPDVTRIYAKVNLTALREVADVDLGELV